MNLFLFYISWNRLCSMYTYVQIIMFSSKISKNSKNRISTLQQHSFYPVAKSKENSARWYSDASWQPYFCGVLFCGCQDWRKVKMLVFGCSWQRFFSGLLFCGCQGLKKRQYAGLRMLLGSVFSAVCYFAGARVWRKVSTLVFGCSLTAFFFSGVLFCGRQGLKKRQHAGFGCSLTVFFSLLYYLAGARVWRKVSTLVYECSLTAFFLWCTILRAPGFEEKAARWLSGAPRPSLSETYRTGQLRSARRPLPLPEKELY